MKYENTPHLLIIEVNSIINKLKDLEIDGETMEYILWSIGMEDQMLRQLVLNASWNDLNHLIEEKGELQWVWLPETN